MKKLITLLLAGTMAVSLLACGNDSDTTTATETEEASTTEEQSAQVANPWRDITEEEAVELVPNCFKAPDGATNIAWSVMESEENPLVQLCFDWNDNTYTAREQVTADESVDISGMNYEWTAEDEGTLTNWANGTMDCKFYRYIGEDEYVDVCNWYDADNSALYSLSVVAGNLDGFDIQAAVEQMNRNTATEEHVPVDISGCDTFTQVVDKLESGYGFANTTINGVDVLLVATGVYDNSGTGDGPYAAIDADVYYYNDGIVTLAGYVEAGGTAYPLSVKDGYLYVAGNHFVKKYTFESGATICDEYAYEEFDTNGDATYYYYSETHGVETDDNSQVEDDTVLSKLFDEFDDAEVVEFHPIP
ncbi:MAG: hypothetical protein K6F66_05050 [Pseudobutyrivibrio sp.]|nr:hypothetical protein [Pseudobutyrivibrio sp.]